MSHTEELFPFSLPMFALDFLEELAMQPSATAVIKEVVDSLDWWALRAIERNKIGKIRIDQSVSVGGEARLSERFVLGVDEDLQLVWTVRSNRDLLRLVVVSEGKGNRLWTDKCAVALQCDEAAPPNIMELKDWIQLDRNRAQTAAAAAKDLVEAQAWSFHLYDEFYGHKGPGL